MYSTLDAFIRSWPFAPWLSTVLLACALIYVRGWGDLRRRGVARWHHGQLMAFLAGLAAIFLALASPIELFTGLLLQLHMVQHLLLTMVAPPLLWLSSPLLPILRGLPVPVRGYWVAPLIRLSLVRWFFQKLTHPFIALPVFVTATWVWHVPAFYDHALRSTGWHYLEHLCFLNAALLFWYPIVRPYPSRPRWSVWLLLPYLLLADVQNTILSALLTFSERVLYASYREVPRIGQLSALDDQSAAGVLMWVPGSLVYLLPLFWISVGLFSGPRRRTSVTRLTTRVAQKLPTLGSRRSGVFDLTLTPVLGRFLRWSYARHALQLPLAVLAAIVIYDGLCGPQLAPMNLAGVLPWVHWRGLVILGLFAAGNISCMACPFTLPRALVHRWLPRGREWPRWLRTKWLAVFFFVMFLWTYEAFSLWDRPFWTAWIVLGYFTAAFLVDSIFRDGSFCKFVCPIGQFNFVQSLISPLQVKVRSHTVCSTCRTHDCIRGGPNTHGCAMELFQPIKLSNMDCTFCLDCVHACPHDNVGISGTLFGSITWTDSLRSNVRRLSKRWDLTVMVLVVVFGAFANAAGMVAPVVKWQERLSSTLGMHSPFVITSLYYFIVLAVLPLLAVSSTTVISGWWSQLRREWPDVLMRFSYSLVPLGFGMWLAHYSFHFFGSYETVVPVVARFMADLGFSGASPPSWALSCCRPVADWLLRLEIVCLDFGLLLSLYTSYHIALSLSTGTLQAIKVFLPWAVLTGFLFLVGVWIVLQPMQMRGTMPGSS